jgi:hypothetical protein
VPFIGAQPALADAIDDTATIDSLTVGAGRVVTVDWSVAAGSQTAATDVDVVITDPDNGAVADEGTCDDDSGYVAVATGSVCTFTAGATDGTYTVQVIPVNVGGTTDTSANSDTETVTVEKPVGQVSSLNATASGATVTASWNLAGITDWGTTEGRDLKIVVTGGSVGAGSTCTTAAATSGSTTCSFTATAASAATYTVKVTATNNAGDSSTFATKNVFVAAPASAPTGGVSNLSAVATGATVNVSWNAAGVTWGSGTGQGFLVGITRAGGGGGVGANTCTGTLAKTITGCQFSATELDTYTVTVTPTSSIGNSATAAQDAVVVSAIAPVGTLATSGVNATASGADVTVTWTPGNITDWGAGAASTHVFDVVVDPDTIEDEGTCTTGLAKAVNTCTFTATAAGTYTVTVTPKNSAGSGISVSDTAAVSASGPTNSAQDLLLATAVDGAQVQVTWDTSGIDWGLFPENSGFEVSVDNPVGENTCGMDPDGSLGDELLPATTEQCTFTATTAGAYTITLRPVNDTGNGTQAQDTATATAAVPVQAPTPTASTPDEDGVVTVEWAAIQNADWGSGTDRAIDVEVSPSGSAAGSGGSIAGGTCGEDMPEDTTECTFTPSTAGTYTVTLTPKTEEGRGAARNLNVAVAGTAPTGEVSDLEATVVGSTVTVTWDGSTVTWGTGTNRVLKVAITGGDVGASTCTSTVASTEESCQFTALDEATYTITVTPSNSEGDADAADDTVDVETLAPAAPTAVAVEAGESSLTVSWTAGDDNGIEVTYYTATANPGGASCSTAEGTSCTIAGLMPGTPYLVTVVANSAAGTGSDASDPGQGTPMGAQPSGSTARNANGQLQVFARAANGNVLTSVQDQNGDWGAWTSLGGSIVGEPVAFRSRSGQLHLLAVGTDTAVWQSQQTSANSNSWSAWTSLGAGDVRSIAVAVSGSGEAVFVSRTGDGSVWTKSQTAPNGTSWTAWEGLGFGAVNDPRVVVNAAGNLEVLAVGRDNALWHRVRIGTTWSPWAMVGGSVSSAVAA